jgi:Domain of unknown function (DUF4124)
VKKIHPKADLIDWNERSGRWIMAVRVLLAALFLFCGSESFAQVYKYVGKDGKVYYTDNPSSPFIKDDRPQMEQKSRDKEQIVPRKRSTETVKDVNQLGEELLAKELAKPPEKQDQRLIQELREALHGDVAEKKGKNPEETKNKDWNIFNRLTGKASKNE